MGKKTRRDGFTIIEMAIVFSLMAVVLASASMAVKRGNDLFEQVTATSEVSARAGRSMERIVRELRSASQITFAQNLTTPQAAPSKVWSPRLDYQTALDWDGVAVVWDVAQRFDLEMGTGEVDNGVDDNGNGLVDERTLVLLANPGQADELRAVIATGVAELLEGELPNGADDNGNQMDDERGFCLELDDNNALTIRLTLERMGPDGRLIVRTQQDTILLRN